MLELPRCEGEIARSAKSHTFTTTGQYEGGINLNTLGGWSNGVNCYIEGKKIGSTLYFPGNTARNPVEVIIEELGKWGFAFEATVRNLERVRYIWLGLWQNNLYISPAHYDGYHAMAIPVRAVHD